MPKTAAPPPVKYDTIPGEYITTREGAAPLKPVVRPDNFQPWVSAVIFLAFLVLVILRVFDWRRMRQLLSGITRISAVSMYYREEYALTNRISILLTLNFLLCGALFITQLVRVYAGDALPVQPFVLFLLVAGGLFLTYLLKWLGVLLLGQVFHVKEPAAEYSYTVFLFNKALGIMLFPVVVALAFAVQLKAEWLVYAGLGFWGIMLIYRILRGVLIGISAGGVSIFNLFIYLCTLEILPFVLITKALRDFFFRV